MKQITYSISIVLLLLSTFVQAQNRAPIAKNDIKATLMNVTARSNVLVNDFDLDGDNLSITPLSQPTAGTLFFPGFSSGVYNYTPNNGFTGQDFFTYRVCDNGSPSLCDTAIVFLTIINPTAGNDAPVAQYDAYVTYEDIPISVSLINNDFDPDGDPLTVNTTPNILPFNGVSVFDPTDGVMSYTPNSGFTGVEIMNYTVCDPSGSCSSANIKIDVLPTDNSVTNSLPLPADDAYLGFMNTPITGNVGLNDTDREGDFLVIASLPIIDVDSGSLVLNTDGTFTYTPDPGFCGVDRFVYEICDNGPSGNPCTEATVEIVVSCGAGMGPVNAAPVAVNDVNTTMLNTMVMGNALTNDFDPDGNIFIAGTTLATLPSNGSATITALGDYTYTPNQGFAGIDSFQYVICDGGTPIMCDSAWIIITVTGCPMITNVQAAVPNCGDNNGSIIITASGGNNLLYSIDNGTTWQTSNSFMGLGAGIYNAVVSLSDTTCMTFYNLNPAIFPNNQPSDTTFIQTTSCDQNQIGTFTQTLTNTVGCDSVVVNTVSLVQSDTTNLMATTCDPNQAGITMVTLTGQSGCDSVIVTNTILVQSDTTNIMATTCDPNQAGVTMVTLTGQSGCDSVIVTNTILVQSDTTNIMATTCDPNQAGITTVTLTNQDGCDSVIVTNTILGNSITTNLQATTCDPSQVGVDTMTIMGQGGCDSLIITTTTLLPTDTTNLQVTTCDSSQVGIVFTTLTNQDGCDSVIVTTTVLGNSITTNLQATTCDPNQVGVDTMTIMGQSGCDSLIITTTTLLPTDTTNLQVTTCDSSQVGVVFTTLTNQDGCDSVIVTTTILGNSVTTNLQATTCDPNQVGISTMTLTSQTGCDSLVITTTTLLPTDTVMVQATTCDPNQVGIATMTLMNHDGCDSVIVTTTTLVAADTTMLQATTCDPLQVGVSTMTITAQNGCDSVIITNTILQALDTTFVQLATCDSAQVGSTMMTLTSQDGCDSVVVTTTSLIGNVNVVTINDTTICAGSSVELQAIGGGTYFWDPHNTLNDPTIANPIATPLSTTTYQVVVTNGSCIDSASVTVTVIPDLDATTTVLNDVSCFGDNNGTAFVSATSNSLLSYSWSSGDSTDFASELTAGFHYVTVTDAFGCSDSASVFINQPASGVSIQSSVTDAPCNTNGGSASITVTGGTAPYTYSWSNGADSTTSTGLSVGEHSVTVTDNTGCSVSDTVFVSFTNIPFVSPATTDVSCYNGNDGAIDLNITGGVAPYDFLWSNNDTTEDLTNLTAGNYGVLITDANGCLVLRSYTVNDNNTPFLVDTTLVQPSCGMNDGSAGVTVTSGDGPYTYLWNTGNTTAILTGLSQGDYALTVTDVNGCSFDYEFEMLPTGSPIAAFTAEVFDTAVQVTNNSVGGDTYQWILGNGDTLTGFEPLLTYDSSGAYDITLIVTNNCGFDTAMTSVFFIVLNTNTIDLSHQVEVAPNPTSGNFRLSLNGLPYGDWNLELRNVTGQLVQQTTFDNQVPQNILYLDIQNQPAGMYFLHLYNNKGALITKKVLLVKN